MFSKDAGGREEISLSTLSFLQVKNKLQRVRTIYDCQADNDDELTFAEGEVIVVTGEEDQEWWVGNWDHLSVQTSVSLLSCKVEQPATPVQTLELLEYLPLSPLIS